MVAIFRSLEGESLEDFSIRLAQAWRIGQKGLDNGVIFLVFLDDRQMRIEVGYGLEPTLTDAIASSILRDVVAPRFRQGKIADGIAAGLTAIQAAIKGTYRGPPARAARRGDVQSTRFGSHCSPRLTIRCTSAPYSIPAARADSAKSSPRASCGFGFASMT